MSHANIKVPAMKTVLVCGRGTNVLSCVNVPFSVIICLSHACARSVTTSVPATRNTTMNALPTAYVNVLAPFAPIRT